ncbi:MAG: hypothetical protein QXK76_03000 [Candidatus Woesearchaeota archaeon]
MHTIRYNIKNIDEIFLKGDNTDRIADIYARERGKKLLRELLALFPERERIETYGPFRKTGFEMNNHSKIRIYHDPKFSIVVYREYECIPKRTDSIKAIELFISSENKDIIEQKRDSIDKILEKYNNDAGNKIKIESTIIE